MIRRYVISILVKNTSGVLAKVIGLISRRGYNIHSLSVGETQDKSISRITIELMGDDSELEQVKKQFSKLVDVIKVKALRSSNSVYRELVLVKVKADADRRAGIIELCDIFRTKIVDVSPKAMVIELSASPEKNRALIELLDEYGIMEMSRTGITAIQRGDGRING